MSSVDDVKAVEMVQRIRDRHHELLENKSPEERARFYREQAEILHRELGMRGQAQKGT